MFTPITRQKHGKVTAVSIRNEINKTFGTEIHFGKNKNQSRINADLRKIYFLICSKNDILIEDACKRVGVKLLAAKVSLSEGLVLMCNEDFSNKYNRAVNTLKKENVFHAEV